MRLARGGWVRITRVGISLMNKVLNSISMILQTHLEVPLIIIFICSLLIRFRSSPKGVVFVRNRRARLIARESIRRLKKLPARPYPKAVPKYPTVIVGLMAFSVIWCLCIIWMWLGSIGTPAAATSPSPSPSPSSPATFSAVSAITTNTELDLMVRSEPFIGSSIVNTYPPNSKLTVECFAEGSEVFDGSIVSSVWYKIYGQDAWVSSIYVSTSQIVDTCLD